MQPIARDHYAENGGTTLTVTVALLMLLLLLPALLRPTEFLPDDSYFYLQIADHLRAGHGSTFHGITPTNGYHPLWMGGAVAAVVLADGDRQWTLHLVVAIQALLTLGTALVFHRLARAMGLADWMAGLAIVLCYLLGTGLYASEAHLNALLLTAGLWSLWHALANDRPRAWFVTGLLFGLAILARLDNLFVAGALCGLGVLHESKNRAPTMARRAAAATFGGLLVLAPYLAWNAVQYGHLMPISGAIKSIFPAFDFDLNRLGAMGKLAAPFGVLALVIGGWLDDALRRRVLWLGLGAGVVLHAVYVAGFTDHYTFWAWYYVSGVLAAGLCAAWLPGWVAKQLAPRRIADFARPAAIAFTLLILVAGMGRALLKAWNPLQLGPFAIDIPINEYRWTEEFAHWLKAHLPPGSRLFTYDWPGAIAWHSGLAVLPMDGLMSDYRYNDDLLAMGAQAYLCAHDVRYFFGLVEEGSDTAIVPVRAPLTRQPAGELVLRADALVVKVRDVVSRPDAALPFAVWRLDCPAP